MRRSSMRYEYSSKPRECPACGSGPVADILWGMPEMSPRLEEDLAAGRVILGGCCVSGDDPIWACASCKIEIYATRSPVASVLSWNVGQAGKPRGDVSVLNPFEHGQPPIDIVTLQEVPAQASSQFLERLDEMGLTNATYSRLPADGGMSYGSIIASRWPLEPQGRSAGVSALSYPQMVAHASVALFEKAVHVITLHAPNGSGYGWTKIRTLRAVQALVESIRGEPCILTGDFNEPQFDLQDGRIVTWGQERDGPHDRYECWKKWTFDGESGTGAEWDTAVRWFFENGHEHGLRLALWDACGPGTMVETHTNRHRPRWFDHAFVSRDFRVESCRSLREPEFREVSDHSPQLVELTADRR